MFQAELSYAKGSQDGGGGARPWDMSVIGWGARFERMFHGGPLTGFLAYEGAYYDNEGASSGFADDGQFAEHVILLGAKLQFGTESLKANDRYGATLDIPNIGRWAAYGETLD